MFRLAGDDTQIYLTKDTCVVGPFSAMILRGAFSETRVRSAALTLRYLYLPLEAANASAARTRGPAYLSTPSLAWRQ